MWWTAFRSYTRVIGLPWRKFYRGLHSKQASTLAEEEGARRRKETIRSLLQRKPAAEETCTVYGWAKSIQNRKTTSFIHLDDGSGERLQVVVSNAQLEQRLSYGAALACTGRLVASPGRQQLFELACDHLQVIGSNDEQYGEKTLVEARHHYHEEDQVNVRLHRERVHLRPRHRYFQSIARLRSELQNGVHIFMKQEEFTNCTPPVITTNDCEGGGQAFSLAPEDYFGRPVSLSVSGQLHLEALAASLGRVYSLGPIFRAERSMSPKHLSEFFMLEAEEAFIFHLPDLLDRIETLVKFLLYYLESNCGQELAYLRKVNNYQDWRPAVDRRFVRVDFQQALDELASDEKYAHFKHWKEAAAPHLNAEMERRLVERAGGVPVMVTNFPAEQKPFYMQRSEDGRRAACFDLLMPVSGEVAGGSLREADGSKLEEAMRAQGLAVEPMAWYVDLRRYGYAPTGGFGLGFDRLLQTASGVANIKDIVPFPRWPQHCYL